MSPFRTNFRACLKFGNEYADKALSLYAKGREVQVIPGNFKPYDALIQGEKVEVKTDTYAHKYNSFFIEYTYKGEPSGVQTTEADTWMHVVWKPDGDFVCYAIPIDRLRKAITDPRTYEKKGGDGWKSVGKIVPADLFEDCKL